MSSAPAGKFQDHYEVFGIDPYSSLEVIKETYKRLSQQARELLDHDRMDSLKQALEVLADPMLRREFDKLKGLSEEKGGPKFSGLPFFDSLGRDARLRMALLCMLYDRRRTKPHTPSLSVRIIEGMLHATAEEITLALWYLKQTNLAANDDKSSVLITVEGIDFLERETPKASNVMPFFKTSAVRGATPESQPAAAAFQLEVVDLEPLDLDPEPVLAGPTALSLGQAPNPADSLAILRRVLNRS